MKKQLVLIVHCPSLGITVILKSQLYDDLQGRHIAHVSIYQMYDNLKAFVDPQTVMIDEITPDK